MKLLIKNLIFIPLILLSLTPLIWFYGKGDVLINGVDTNFPLEPLVWFLRRLFVWNATVNAGADFSSSTAGLFFHLIQVLPYQFGASLKTVQILSILFWFMLFIASSYIFARVLLPKKPLIQLLFVVLYSFNIYLFNTWENIKVANISLVASIPLALAILFLLREQKITRVAAAFYSALVGIVLSGAGINPSYFFSFFFLLGIYGIASVSSSVNGRIAIERLKDFAVVCVLIVVVNLFWILPTTKFVLSNITPFGSIDKIGFTNWIDSLSDNTSLLNVMRLQGAWDWYAIDSVTGLPLYIPYSLNYFHRFPFLIFSFLLVGLVILSLVLRDKKKHYLYIAFCLMFLIGVFLGAGTHLPTGSAFRWLINHTPFFSFFRSPWYIFTPLVTLSTAALVAMLAYNFEQRLQKVQPSITRMVIPLFVVIVIVGNFFYSYPLITGKIFRPTQPDSFFVKFPSYVFETKDWLHNQDGVRIIGYPDDEIEKFGWGYRSIESILGLFVSKEVVFNPLNAPDSNVAVLIKKFYEFLKKGELDGAATLAEKLNIGFVFEKGDQESLSPALPDMINEREKFSFGQWNFYKFPPETIPKIFSPSTLFLGPVRKDGVQILGVVPKEGILLNQEDSIVKSINTLEGYYGAILLSKNSQAEDLKKLAYSPSALANRLVLRNLSIVEFTLDVPEESEYSPILDRYRLEDFGIGIQGQLELEIDRKKTLWDVDKISDSYLYFRKVNFSKGKHVISIKLKNENLISGGDFNSGITFKKGGYGEGRGEYIISEDSSGKFLQIFNIGKANVSADFPVSSFDPLMPYYVELKYKQVYGNNAAIVVTQNTKSTLVKAQTERLPNYPEWNSFSFYYEPVQTGSFMEVNLEAPFTSDPLGTKVFYDDLRVFKVFSNNLMFVKDVSPAKLIKPNISFTKQSLVSYTAEVKNANGPHLIVFSENYSPEWELTATDANSFLLPIVPLHFSANVYANAWYLDKTLPEYTFKIYYRPQRLFIIGLLLGGISVIVSFLLFLRSRKRR